MSTACPVSCLCLHQCVWGFASRHLVVTILLQLVFAWFWNKKQQNWIHHSIKFRKRIKYFNPVFSLELTAVMHVRLLLWNYQMCVVHWLPAELFLWNYDVTSQFQSEKTDSMRTDQSKDQALSVCLRVCRHALPCYNCEPGVYTPAI